MATEEDALREFVSRYSRPYDAEKDAYDRPPFAEDIKEGKNDPIYNVYSYHTKVPPRGIIPYILHYTEPGDLILDPFCGSGMTGIAALMCSAPPADLHARLESPWLHSTTSMHSMAGSATMLGIEEATVDYIFADPPFGSNIDYTELSLLWEAWLGSTTDATLEAVVHRKNDGGTKRIEDYSRFMHLAFSEMFRVLKHGRWATVEFNNSTWGRRGPPVKRGKP